METLLELSKTANQTADWMHSLDSIIQELRKNLIFDNIVIYHTEPDSRRLEVIYARATGRGKSAEAEVNWGEGIASKVAHENQVYLDEPKHQGDDRLKSPFLLGIPINGFTKLPGSIIFIRFGGPSYTPQDIEYAGFASQMMSHVINSKLLDDVSQILENQKNTARLQEEFIHTISHELRSPLGFIKGYTTTLLREDANWDAQTQTDFLKIIERETNNLQDLINDLLDSARLQSGQLRMDYQIVRVDSIIRDEINRHKMNHPDVQFVFQPTANIPPVEADPRRLSQVIENLINNSLKYAPGSPIYFNILENDDSLSIQISDDGPGIPPAFISQVFTRFFRSPDQSLKVRGTGLGLYICKQIIEQLKGTISVESPPEHGAIFTITLPLLDNHRMNRGLENSYGN